MKVKEAHRWDGMEETEGRVVRYYRHPQHEGEAICHICEKPLHEHGFIDAPNTVFDGGQPVCPGSWIVELQDGRFFAQREEVFYLRSDELCVGC